MRRWFVLVAGGAGLTLIAIALYVSQRDTTSALSEATTTVPTFRDDTQTAGIDHNYDGEFEFFVGGGVSAFDCDDDGRPDLYFAGGSEPAGLYRNESPTGGELQFTQATSTVTDLDSVTGSYPIDIDSDTKMDLVVLRLGGNVVLRGLGDCRFEVANERLGVDAGQAWTTAFSAVWEGSNSLPTLALGNYLIPGTTRCDESSLLRPAPHADLYQPPISLAPGYCTLSMLFSAWGRSGQADLRVANDRHYYNEGSEQLWQVVPGEPPREYTEADGWQPLRIWGMGIASRDVTGDGLPEVLITSQGDNKLQSLSAGPEQPAYSDIALVRGATAHRPFVGGDVLPSTAWHPEFGDVNNDGRIDLFITKGNVEAQPDFAAKDPNNLLIGQADGTFVEGADDAGIAGFVPSRGAALVDLNLDGMLDLVVVHRRENVTLWRNVGTGNNQQSEPIGNWIGLRLEQPAPNVDAVGAWIEVRVGDAISTRELTIGGGHAGGQSGWLHAGLGNANQAEVRVSWPNGEIGNWIAVEANQFVTIERGAAEPSPWSPTQ